MRNINGNGAESKLAWSFDRGKTWTCSPWKFEEFGYPTFINFGKDYSNARHRYVYTVSHDHPSAHQSADRFILLRVDRTLITSRRGYEFFKTIDSNGRAQWTDNISQRGAVFKNTAKCLRPGITFNAALGRYLWWQQIPARRHVADTRNSGGFGV